MALVSSGLDSLLAAKIVKDLGVAVEGIYFFFRFDSRKRERGGWNADDLFRPLGIRGKVVDMSEAMLRILRDPAHGYGSGMNPCIDCRLYMLDQARAYMEEVGAQFLVTGEVVGQRPMTQNKPTLFHIDKVSGLKGLILRPLSAKLLPVTLPEERGWVDRERLFDFSGRSRRPQMALAERLGISGFQQPAGGCILTEPNFSRRAGVLFSRRGKGGVTVEGLELLRFGRHLWPNDHLHVVVGRDEGENRALAIFREGRWTFSAMDTEGPLVLADGLQDVRDREIVASITARYCDENGASGVRVRYEGDGKEGSVRVQPVGDALLERWRV